MAGRRWENKMMRMLGEQISVFLALEKMNCCYGRCAVRRAYTVES